MNIARRKLSTKTLAALLLADLALGVVFAGNAVTAANAAETALDNAAAPAVPQSIITASAETKAWTDTARDVTDPNYAAFQNLSVTVGQTNDLTYQGLTVNWTGGTATSPSEFGHDYLQIMQCWDDGTGSAKPQNCQWGAPASSFASVLGLNAGNRSLSENEDSAQQYSGIFQIPAPSRNPNLRAFQVPFTSINGVSTFDVNTFFSSTSSNEVSGATTSADGTGTVLFELQTSLEAPHLGCGALNPDTGEIRDCWLVVVPRGQYSTDGTSYTTHENSRLRTSPLSASNWADRIEFHLGFASISSGCPIGASEERTVGNEMISEAFTSWQGALCASNRVFGFSQVGDDEARTQIASSITGASRIGFINAPLSAEQSSAKVAYAPVAQSALVIAYNIDYNVAGNSSLISHNGRPVTNLKLSPRLVAKMLTQSYKNDVPNGNNQSYLASNPRSLRHDPEFLALNPDFKDFLNSSEPDGILLPLGNSDAFAQVWNWLKADTDARAFLSGAPDPWGTVINRYYANLNILDDGTINSFPKADQSTYREADYIPAPGFGSFELRPYVGDLAEGARKVRRGDTGIKIFWDTTRAPAAFVSSGLQYPGQHFLFALTDVASAAKLGLPTAQLRNNAGAYVPATEESITAGIEAFTETSVDGVTVYDRDSISQAAYPLATVTYAAVAYCAASLDQLTQYTSLLNYIKSDGQVSGTTRGNLPEGYVPLSTTQTSQLNSLITKVHNEAVDPQCPEHQAPVAPTTEPEAATTVTPETPIVSPVDPGVTSETVSAEYIDAKNSVLRYSFLSALCFGVPLLGSGRYMKSLSKRHPDDSED